MLSLFEILLRRRRRKKEEEIMVRSVERILRYLRCVDIEMISCV